jgi:hypothetical protein
MAIEEHHRPTGKLHRTMGSIFEGRLAQPVTGTSADADARHSPTAGGVRLGHFRVADIRLPLDGAVLREPTRPDHLRGEGFDDQFDRQTLIYDGIAGAGNDPARLIGPPLLNLDHAVRRACFGSASGDTKYPFKIRDLDRQSQILIRLPPETRSVRMTSELGDYTINLNDQEHEFFAGQRVVFTLSKNNRLIWIKDWARFYRDVHGATAFVIVDNASTAYSSTELLDALGSIGGISCAAVIDWPFRHGPTGLGQRKFWDSNFSQLGAFEVLRWRFLRQARSVLNCDIDELVLSDSPRSIFEHAENSLSGVAAFYGDWVFGFEDRTRTATETDPIRFWDFQHMLLREAVYKYGIVPQYPMRCRAKWAAVPRRCPAAAQWHIHKIDGWLSSRIASKHFQFRHFREINFNWKYDRVARQRFDPARHVDDPLMRDAFARVRWEG